MKINIFKYFIITVVAISIVCSCDINSLDTPTEETSSAIGFSNVSTKANKSDLEKDGFGVWATISNATNPLYMNNVHVEYNTNTNSWEYNPLSYWISETVFNFVATYPYDEEGDEDGTFYTFDSNNSAVMLTVSETPSEKDFLIATNTTDTSEESFDYTKEVNLYFQHMLTSVVLQIWRDGAKHQNDQMRIKQVTLSNVSKSGEYSTKTQNWTLNNDKVTVQKVYENLADTDDIGVAVNDGNNLTTTGVPANPFGVMMLIPQDLNRNPVSLKIKYQLKRQNAADWEDAELETYLPAVTWESNKRYTYNLVLSSVTDITIYYIQTKVDPWGTPQVGGTVIIK